MGTVRKVYYTGILSFSKRGTRPRNTMIGHSSVYMCVLNDDGICEEISGIPTMKTKLLFWFFVSADDGLGNAGSPRRSDRESFAPMFRVSAWRIRYPFSS